MARSKKMAISAHILGQRLKRMRIELTQLGDAWDARRGAIAHRMIENRSGAVLVQSRFNRAGLALAELIALFE
jgi:hypothetical protein